VNLTSIAMVAVLCPVCRIKGLVHDKYIDRWGVTSGTICMAFSKDLIYIRSLFLVLVLLGPTTLSLVTYIKD
jgi:hypothetical protein